MGRKPMGPDENAAPFRKAMAAHIGELIAARGLTDKEVAAAIGASKQSFSNWKRCVADFPVEIYPALAAALKLERVSDLIPTEFDPPTRSES